MSDERTANLLGALGLGIADLLTLEAGELAGHGGQTAAAIVTIGATPDLTVGRLGWALGLSQPGAVRLVDRLARDGLVARGTAKDGRAVALQLTEAGSRRRAAILARRSESVRALLEVLAPEERRLLDGIASKLLAGMTTDRARAYALCRLCDEAVCEAGGGCPVEQACPAAEEVP